MEDGEEQSNDVRARKAYHTKGSQWRFERQTDFEKNHEWPFGNLDKESAVYLTPYEQHQVIEYKPELKPKLDYEFYHRNEPSTPAISKISLNNGGHSLTALSEEPNTLNYFMLVLTAGFAIFAVSLLFIIVCRIVESALGRKYDNRHTDITETRRPQCPHGLINDTIVPTSNMRPIFDVARLNYDADEYNEVYVTINQIDSGSYANLVNPMAAKDVLPPSYSACELAEDQLPPSYSSCELHEAIINEVQTRQERSTATHVGNSCNRSPSRSGSI